MEHRRNYWYPWVKISLTYAHWTPKPNLIFICFSLLLVHFHLIGFLAVLSFHHCKYLHEFWLWNGNIIRSSFTLHMSCNKTIIRILLFKRVTPSSGTHRLPWYQRYLRPRKHSNMQWLNFMQGDAQMMKMKIVGRQFFKMHNPWVSDHSMILKILTKNNPLARILFKMISSKQVDVYS